MDKLSKILLGVMIAMVIMVSYNTYSYVRMYFYVKDIGKVLDNELVYKKAAYEFFGNEKK